MSRVFLPSVAMATLWGGSALASGPAPAPVEPPVEAPVAAERFDWSGAYVGLQAGALNGDIRGDAAYRFFISYYEEEEYHSSPDASGATLGVYGGYNWQGSGNLVYGIEGEFNGSNADGSDGVHPAPDNSFTSLSWDDGYVDVDTLRVDSEITSTAALRGRIGYAMDRTLLYVTGGAAFAEYDLTLSGDPYLYGPGSMPDTEFGSINDSRTGWTIGLGVEHAISDALTARLDYRYSDYGTETYRFEDIGGDYTDGTADIDVDMSTSEIRVGLAYRF